MQVCFSKYPRDIFTHFVSVILHWTKACSDMFLTSVLLYHRSNLVVPFAYRGGQWDIDWQGR